MHLFAYGVLCVLACSYKTTGTCTYLHIITSSVATSNVSGYLYTPPSVGTCTCLPACQPVYTPYAVYRQREVHYIPRWMHVHTHTHTPRLHGAHPAQVVRPAVRPSVSQPAKPAFWAPARDEKKRGPARRPGPASQPAHTRPKNRDKIFYRLQCPHRTALNGLVARCPGSGCCAWRRRRTAAILLLLLLLPVWAVHVHTITCGPTCSIHRYLRTAEPRAR